MIIIESYMIEMKCCISDDDIRNLDLSVTMIIVACCPIEVSSGKPSWNYLLSEISCDFLWSEYFVTEFFIFEYLKYFFVELKLAEFKFQIPKPHFNNIQVEALNY